MFIYGIKINSDSTFIPKDYLKLFISYKNYNQILKEHIEIHKTEDINIFYTKDKLLISNFDKFVYIMQKHPKLSNFYYYPFGNIDELFNDFKKILLKITSSNISFDEILSKSIYQKLDKILKKYITVSKSKENNIYNPCFKDFSNYCKNNEYLYIQEEYKKIIKKLSDINNCNWKNDLLELNDYLYHNNAPSYTFKNDIKINKKEYIYFYKFVNDENEIIYNLITEDIYIISEYPEIILINLFVYKKNKTSITEYYISNQKKPFIKKEDIYYNSIDIYFNYFFYMYYDNKIEKFIKYKNFKEHFIKFINIVNNNFSYILTSQKLKKILLNKNIEFKRKNDGFYIKSIN